MDRASASDHNNRETVVGKLIRLYARRKERKYDDAHTCTYTDIITFFVSVFPANFGQFLMFLDWLSLHHFYSYCYRGSKLFICIYLLEKLTLKSKPGRKTLEEERRIIPYGRKEKERRRKRRKEALSPLSLVSKVISH